MGPFDRVATSVVPRARETAIAMGFAVDYRDRHPDLGRGHMAAEFEDNQWWLTPRPFEALAKVVTSGGPTHLYANSIVALWRDMMTAIADGSAALVIGHSGQLEAALVACFPKADHASWGGQFGCCEGARLTFDGEPARFTGLEFLRETDARGR